NLRDEFARGGHGSGLLELHGWAGTESDDGEGSLDVGRRVEQDAGGAGNVGDGDADRHHHVGLGRDPRPAFTEYARFEIDVHDAAGSTEVLAVENLDQPTLVAGDRALAADLRGEVDAVESAAPQRHVVDHHVGGRRGGIGGRVGVPATVGDGA